MNDIELVSTMITIAATHNPAMIGVLRLLVGFYIKIYIIMSMHFKLYIYMSQSVTWQNIS